MAKRSVLNHKGKILAPLILFTDGDVIDYQTVIEEKVGMWLSEMKIYDSNFDNKDEINGESIESDRAYFVSDGTYEITIKKII